MNIAARSEAYFPFHLLDHDHHQMQTMGKENLVCDIHVSCFVFYCKIGQAHCRT